MVGIVVLAPFLIPILAPLLLSVLAGTNLPSANFEQAPFVIAALIVTIVGGVGLGYFRSQVITWLKISPTSLADFAGLGWLLPWWAALLDWVGKFVLRVRVILEGQHYIGWALFTALVGVLIILLEK